MARASARFTRCARTPVATWTRVPTKAMRARKKWDEAAARADQGAAGSDLREEPVALAFSQLLLHSQAVLSWERRLG